MFSHLSNESVLGLELLGVVHGLVDEGETGALATTEGRLEPEGDDQVGRRLVHLGQVVADLRLGDRRLAGVKDVDDHLLPVQELVGHELAGPHGHS